MKLYRGLAKWWPLFSSPDDDDYRQEAALFHDILVERAARPIAEVLELGSGGGNIASYLKASWRLTLSDLSEEMLEVSRQLNLECEHVRGDMRTLRLGRTFDAIFVHDAVSYMTTRADLQAALQTAYVHCRSGGAAVFAPDATRETFECQTQHGGEDGARTALRYLSWQFDPDPSDTTYNQIFALILRAEDGKVSFEHDEHVQGLFSRSDWNDALAAAGFIPSILADQWGRDLFVGTKPHFDPGGPKPESTT